jgi:hypothetical protein
MSLAPRPDLAKVRRATLEEATRGYRLAAARCIQLLDAGGGWTSAEERQIAYVMFWTAETSIGQPGPPDAPPPPPEVRDQ